MPREIPKWPREKIQQELLKDIAEMDLVDQAWIHELIPLLREFYDLAGEPHADAQRLASLRNRVSLVLRKHRLKGLDGYLWMIDCLRETRDAT
jgi:hypothetical protein